MSFRRARLRSRVARAVSVAVLAGSVVPAAAGVAAADTTDTAGTTGTSATSTVLGSAALPFAMPATSTLRASSKKVFAHYLASLTPSLDNQDPATDYYARNYLTPTGEGGIHAAYGGFLRDRPLPRTPLSTSSWRLEDAEAEVRQAIGAGLDGFAYDVLQVQGGSVPQLFDNARTMVAAAAAVDPGFKIMLMPDMAGSLGSKDVPTLAAGMATLGRSSAAYHLADGRLVVSPFKAETHSAAWWKSFIDTMKGSYGIPVALLPVFVGNEQTYAPSFAPISYGMSNWGSRNPQYNDPTLTSPGSPVARARAVKALGKAWMQPVSLQDARPNQAVFDEAENTTNLRDTWAVARAAGADLVQIPTWNDYTEGTAIAPSAKHGWSFLDVTAYYAAWYKTGTAPTITKDAVVVSHRTQPVAAAPRFAQTSLMHLRGGSPARDTVEALTFMTAPGTVTVNVGSHSYVCAVGAGVDTCTVPLGTGTVSARTSRGGITTAAVTSPRTVTSSPYVQDLEYTAASSARTPTAPVTLSGTPTLVDRVVEVTASADTYANAGAPGTSYGTSSSLSSRGTVGAASYLRFPVPAAPAGTVLTGGSLSLRSLDDGYAASTDAQTVSLADGGWSEGGVTWRARPALHAAVGRIASVRPSTTYLTPLSTSVLGSLAGGASLAITSTGTDEARFWSHDFQGPSVRPRLVLRYSPVPVAPVAPTSVGSATTQTLTPTADTYANEGAPGTAFGSSSSLSVRGELGAVSYLRFALPAAPAGQVLTRAVFTVRTNVDPTAGSADDTAVVLSPDTWSEDSLTWRERPAPSATRLGVLTGTTSPDTAYSTDLDVAALRGLAGSSQTLALTATGTDSLWLWSAEHANASLRPQLELTWAPAV